MPKSTTPRNNETIITSTMTTMVEPTVCLRDGQVTFLSSTLTSRKNWADLVNILSLGLAAAGGVAEACFFRGKAVFFFATLTAASPEDAIFTPFSLSS
jgi:hypothetical protein